MSEEIRVYRPNLLLKNLLLVDGVARCGKSLLCPILASFERVEIERMENLFEWVNIMHSLGKITHDAAVSLLQQSTDEFIYNSYLSRNINFRWQDHSSVFKHPRRMRYLRRLFVREGEDTARKIIEEEPIFQTQCHDQMPIVALHFDVYAKGFKMIEFIRNPIDLIDAWWRRKWGTRYCNDPLSFTICIKKGDITVPFYAIGWEEEYLELKPMDRIIRMLHGLQMKCRKGYEELTPQKKERIYLIKFEDFVVDPFPHIERIASFLGTSPTRSTSKSVKAQGCPRKLSKEKQDKRYNNIKAHCSSVSLKLMDEMISDYDIHWS